MTKGSTRNDQKRQEKRSKSASVREKEARKILAELDCIPIFRRSEDHSQLKKQWRGILKKAITDRRKSETHSVKGKGTR